MKSLIQAILITIFAATGMNCTTPALAGGEGGASNYNISNGKKSSTNKKKKKSRKVSVIYTQKNFHKISDKDLKTAIKGNKTGHNIVVEGFSKRMSSKLFEMALTDKKWIVKLMRDMRAKAKKEDREKILKFAWFWNENALIDLEDDGVTTFFPKDPQLLKLKARKKFLKAWRAKPSEGTLKTKR